MGLDELWHFQRSLSLDDEEMLARLWHLVEEELLGPRFLKLLGDQNANISVSKTYWDQCPTVRLHQNVNKPPIICNHGFNYTQRKDEYCDICGP